MNKESLYLRFPLLIQKVLFRIYAYDLMRLKNNKRYEDTLRDLMKSQWFSCAELQDLQNQKLQRIIKHCYDNVPYYKKLFDGLKLKPFDIKTINDLWKIPILTKKDVRENFSELTACNIRRSDMILTNTSGTTGSPLYFYWDKDIYAKTRAYIERHWHWAGFNSDDRRITMHGRMIVSTRRKTSPFWMYNKWDKQLFFSTYHLSERFLSNYIDKLFEYSPQAIEAYPSAIHVLAKYMLGKGIKYKLKAVFTSAETLYPFQRESTRNAFGCAIFDMYGLSERVVMATECEKHSGLHLNMEYGVTEIVDDKGDSVSTGTEGRVISTGLENYSMPLIRYDTGDVSKILDLECECGRQYPILAPITTKNEDQIILPDGRVISGSLLTFPFKPMVNIVKSQIIQEDLDNIVIKIVRNEKYSNEDARLLLDGVSKCMGDEMKIHFEYVEDIPRTSSGKYRWVISKVKKISGITQ